MTLLDEPGMVDLPQRVLALLNASTAEIGLHANASPRTVGDRTQEFLAERLIDSLPPHLVGDYAAEFSRRAMADLAFKDRAGNYYVVDVKTHCRSARFNMPNLISVERLTRFYEDRSNIFCLLIVSYDRVGDDWRFTECVFTPIEGLSWECLTIGALGWGQLQIANANAIHLLSGSRRSWMLRLCDAMLHFYPREIGKIETRIGYFEAARQRWLLRGAEE